MQFRPENEQSESGRFLGIILLVLAMFGLYWMVDAIIQLWNSPKSVPFVSLFIQLLEENQKPTNPSGNGAEINVPASWPVVAEIF